MAGIAQPTAAEAVRIHSRYLLLNIIAYFLALGLAAMWTLPLDQDYPIMFLLTLAFSV